MKIGIDARMYGAKACTGIGQYIEQLTKHLFEIDKHNHYVLFLQEPIFSKFELPNERVKKVLVNAPWYSYAEQIKLPWQFRKEKIDLIHYPQFNSPILFPKKSVCTIHDLTPFKFDGHKMKSQFRKLAHRLVFQSTVKKARKIFTVSNNTKNELAQKFHIAPKKIKTTYLGVDERFKIIENNDIISKATEKYGITKPFIFFIGVWRNHKNIEGLISAFEILKNKYKIAQQLILAGQEDENYTKIREKINQSPHKDEIITPGFIADEDLPAIYNAAEVFVLPSFTEGFGLIAIEAQKCGCPVVSSKTTCMPEVLGHSALFFDPANHHQMAFQIEQVLHRPSLRSNLIAKGLQNIQKYSWKKCALQTLQTYNEILNK